MQFTIHDSSAGGPSIFIQRDTVIPNQFGLINVVIGGGTIVVGNFQNIGWGESAKFLQVELDVTGATNYVDMGTTQLMSVPYALYSGSAANNLPGPTGPTGAQGVPGATGATGPASANDSLWIKNGNNIYNSNSGNVGIQTASPTAALTVNGYSMLGIDAPAVKMKQFTGTTPSTAGDSTSINTWIPDAKVVGVSVLVRDPVNGLLTPLLNLLGVQYTYRFVSSVFTLKTTLLNSGSILNKPYTVLVTYTQ